MGRKGFATKHKSIYTYGAFYRIGPKSENKYLYKLYNIQSTHNCAVNSHIVFSERFFSNQMYYYRSNNN